MKIREFLKLVRFEHALMLAVAVFIGESVAGGKIPEINNILWISLLIPIFSEMGSFALNDYLDIETDRINKKMTPLVRGTINPQFAFYFAWASFIVSLVLAFYINETAITIVGLFNIFAVLYNYKLKDIPLVGNVYISLTMGIPFIFGAVVVSPIIPISIWLLALIGCISGLGREIVKSTEDVEGDIRARRAQTLPILIGRKNALIFAILLYLLFIPLAYLPFNYGLKPSVSSQVLINGAIIGVLYNVLLLYKSYNEEDKTMKEYLKKARKISLISLGIGLLAYLVGVL